MAGDWIKLHRSILNSEVFRKDWHCQLWVWCLCKANYTESKFLGTQLKRGQFVTGTRSGAEQLRVSKSKFHRGLKALEAMGCVELKPGRDWTVVTICNYDTYQGVDIDERDASGTPAGRERDASGTRAGPEERISIKEEGKNGRKEYASRLPDSLPEIIDTPDFRKRLEEWFAYKQQRGARDRYTVAGLSAMISRAANMAKIHGVKAVADAIHRAMANSWAGWDQESSFSPRNGHAKADPRGTFAAMSSYLEKRNQGGTTDAV